MEQIHHVQTEHYQEFHFNMYKHAVTVQMASRQVRGVLSYLI